MAKKQTKKKAKEPDKNDVSAFDAMTLIGIILFCVCGVVLMVIPDEVIGQDEVPCYDKNNNLIQDVVCTEDVVEYHESKEVLLGMVIGFAIMFILGLLLSVIEESGK